MTAREFAGTSIRLIDNDRLFVTAEGTLERTIGASDQKHSMCIAGMGDLWEGDPDCDAALGGVPSSMPRIVLSHNPDICEESCMVKHAPRIDLMLSGHTHGGQIAVPFMARWINASKLAHHFHIGVYKDGDSTLYVHPGLGTTGPPIRLGVAPAVVVHTLRSLRE